MLPEGEVESLAARLTKRANKGFDRLANSAMGNRAFGRVHLNAMDVEHSSRLVSGGCVVDLPLSRLKSGMNSARGTAKEMGTIIRETATLPGGILGSARRRHIATGAGIGVGALIAADVVRHRQMRPSSAQQQYYGY